MEDIVKEAFREAYGGTENAGIYFAPGRVNLIGEHTDYNGGHVFPCALTLGTYAAVRKRADRLIRLASVNFPDTGVITKSLDDIEPGRSEGWEAYPEGVIWAFRNHGMSPDTGFDVMIGGDLPAGSGLSSSASLEVLTGTFLRDLYGFKVSNKDIALLGQEAENRYVGVNCGIMDQFASAMGKKDSAIYLDTTSLEYEYVPLSLGTRKLVITNTNKKHSLNDSAYNDRRRECGEVLKRIQEDPEGAGTASLCGIPEDTFEKLKHCLDDPVLLARARHAVTEDLRTKEAVSVLKAGDVEAFGKLMNESHVSLRDDYEVSCEELDVLAETAWEVPGVIGSRMTGGGFGGCTVSIVEEDAVDLFRETVGNRYKEAFGYDCSFYVVSIGDGPQRIG